MSPRIFRVILMVVLSGCCFKFHQNEGEREEWEASRGVRGSILERIISFIIGKHIQMLCLKFNQNRTINQEFDFWGVKGVVLGGVWGFQIWHNWRSCSKTS